MEFTFHCNNSLAETGAMLSLKKLLGETACPPVILCVGSDLAIGDSLGPLTGTMLKSSMRGLGGFVYGSLKTPVTAKEIKYLKDFLKQTHPHSKVIAVDAALGAEEEVGLIKISGEPLRPGSGAKKRLGKIGDVSILGIVAKSTPFAYSALNLTRLNAVYSMASLISHSIVSLFIESQNTIQNNEKIKKSVVFC